MTSNEVAIITMDIAKKNANEIVARAHGARKGNLALKAKVVEESDDGKDDDDDAIESGPEDVNYDYHEHMALSSKNFWGNKGREFKLRKTQVSEVQVVKE
jgi:hypothetical protein